MNPPPVLASASPAPPRRGWWIALAVLTFVLLALPGALVVTALGCLRLGSDAAALRNAALKSEPNAWSRQVELSLGRLPLAAARTAAGFVDLDPEARTALNAVRGAEVAVYQPRHPAAQASADRAGMFAEADRAMTRRGWVRTVGVMQEDQLVAVYLPEPAAAGGDVRLCVLVANHENLVVISARGRVEPLLELLPRHGTGPGFAWTKLH